MSESRSALLRFAAGRLLRRATPDCATATTSTLSVPIPPVWIHLLDAACAPYCLGAVGGRRATAASSMQLLASSPFPMQFPHAVQRRFFASSAPSRLLALKQRRASIVTRVRIPRWSPATEKVASPPTDGAGAAASVPAAATAGQVQSSAEVQLQGEATAASTAAEPLRYDDALPAAVEANARGAELAEAGFRGNEGALLDVRAGVNGAVLDEGNPRGLPLISAELAAELATGNRHVSMSHLPGGLQRVYERYIEGSGITMSVPFMVVQQNPRIVRNERGAKQCHLFSVVAECAHRLRPYISPAPTPILEPPSPPLVPQVAGCAPPSCGSSRTACSGT